MSEAHWCRLKTWFCCLCIIWQRSWCFSLHVLARKHWNVSAQNDIKTRNQNITLHHYVHRYFICFIIFDIITCPPLASHILDRNVLFIRVLIAHMGGIAADDSDPSVMFVFQSTISQLPPHSWASGSSSLMENYVQMLVRIHVCVLFSSQHIQLLSYVVSMPVSPSVSCSMHSN